MKPNHEEMRNILIEFQKSIKLVTTITDLKSSGFNIANSEFLFNLDLLAEYGFIESYSSRTRDLGIKYSPDAQQLTIHELPLRITANGHEYLANLQEDGVWEHIKKDFKESSVDTIKKVSKELVSNIIKKKLEPFLK